MPYSELPTSYTLYKLWIEEKKKEGKANHLKKLQACCSNPIDFYTFFIKEFTGMDSIMASRCYAEKAWYKVGCPYYNIHPNFISKLCNCNLSKIPASLFKMPHELESIHVRFKDFHSEFAYSSSKTNNLRWATSILVYEIPENEYSKRTISISLDMLMNQNDIGKSLNIYELRTQKKDDRSLCIFNIVLEKNQSLQDAIKIAISKQCDKKGMSLPSDSKYEIFIKNVLSLCSTIGFLSDNPTICEPDILAADRHLIEKSNPQELEALHQKAKNKRKYGWNIGTDRMFVGPQPFQLANKSQAAEGKEREYAHIRAGHPHAVRYGKGKELVKIMWFVPLTVRPDLPFKIEQQTQTTL